MSAAARGDAIAQTRSSWSQAAIRSGCVGLLAGALLSGCAGGGFGPDPVERALAELGRDTGTLPPARPGEEVVLSDGDERFEATLFLPAGPPRAVLVVFPGLTREGRHQPRLARMAQTFSRIGLAVLVAELGRLREFQVAVEDAAEVARVAQAFRRSRHITEGTPLGIGGISYAAGPVLLAAADSTFGGQIDFVLTVGGYADFGHAIRYATTGSIVDPVTGAIRLSEHEPVGYIRWFVGTTLVDLVAGEADRQRLEHYFVGRSRRRIRSVPENLTGADAKALLDLVINEDPARVNSLLSRQSAPIAGRIAGLSPARAGLECMRARLYLVHGRRDNRIPIEESEALARGAPPGQAQLFPLERFAHTAGPLEASEVAPVVKALIGETRERAPRQSSTTGDCVRTLRAASR